MRTKQSRIIVDTNLWISFLITKGYKQLDKLIFSNKAILIFSQELLDEFIEVAKRPKFGIYFRPEDVMELIKLFNYYGELITVSSDVKVCRDLKDNFLLSLAKDSQADYLITGDKDLLEIKNFVKTKILTITDFESLYKGK